MLVPFWGSCQNIGWGYGAKDVRLPVHARVDLGQAREPLECRSACETIRTLSYREPLLAAHAVSPLMARQRAAPHGILIDLDRHQILAGVPTRLTPWKSPSRRCPMPCERNPSYRGHPGAVANLVC